MKTRNLLLALGCAAAFTACTNNDEPAVAPDLRTVTLSVEVAEPADTRVAYTEDGTTYKFEWSASDKLRVFYNDGEEKYADFEIGTYSGKQADFTSTTFPADFTGTVSIAYSSDNNYVGVGRNQIRVSESSESLPEALGKCTYLYAEGVEVTNGNLPAVKLNHAVAYLLLNKNLQVASGSASVAEDTRTYLEFKNNELGMYLSWNSQEVNIDGSPIFPQLAYDNDGKLANNYLIPLPMKVETTLAIKFNWMFYFSNGTWKFGTPVTLKSQTYKPGVIYEVKADNANWEPATLPE